MKYLFSSLFIFSMLILVSCGGENRIEPKNKTNASESVSTGIFEGGENTAKEPHSHSESDIHQVEVLEVLETDKYSYLRVKEDGEPYWIATIKANFTEGEQYEYQGGLLKTNFKSVEHDRVFDRVYLVSQIRPLNDAMEFETTAEPATAKTVSKTFKKPDMEDLNDLKEIVEDPEKFSNKKVRVYGEVVKVNPNIMDRNWMHIKDGTADDFDFVITSQSAVPVGHAMVFEGVISIDKDFGAGYSYELIMENAKPIQ